MFPLFTSMPFWMELHASIYHHNNITEVTKFSISLDCMTPSVGWFIFPKVSPIKLFFKAIVLLTDLSNLCKFQKNRTSLRPPPTAIFVWHICGSQKTQFSHFCKFLRPILTSKIVLEMWFLCHLRAKYLKKLKLSFEESPGCGTALN